MEVSSKQYTVKTLGCKANFYDSQLLEVELQRRGWTPAPPKSTTASLCIVNSCTVTDEADRQSRRMASRLFRDNPNAHIVVTGCAAEVDPERLVGTQGIHYIVGNQDKPRLVELVLKALEQKREGATPEQGTVLGAVENYKDMLSRHPMDREWPTPDEQFFTPPAGLQGHTSRTRAFLKLQEGCNSFCTYCIIPYGRGPSRSLRPSEVISQVSELVARGVREVIITGTNVGDYGADWGEDRPNGVKLAELFETILKETTLERLRVSSLDPTEITPALIELAEREPRLCPHFHVSLQSPHSRILRLMKRRYGFEEVKSCLERISQVRAPLGGSFIGMDLITGFPGETLEEFEWTRQVLTELPWNRLHVFPYSERTGTPATRLSGSLNLSERQRRSRVLTDLSFQRLERYYQETLRQLQNRHALIENVLFERPVKGPDSGQLYWSGYTPNYLRVMVPVRPDTPSLQNQLLQVKPLQLILDRASCDAALLAALP